MLAFSKKIHLNNNFALFHIKFCPLNLPSLFLEWKSQKNTNKQKKTLVLHFLRGGGSFHVFSFLFGHTPIFLSWLSQVPTEVNNRVQSLLLNCHFALLCSGDFTLVYYQMRELEYISYIWVPLISTHNMLSLVDSTFISIHSMLSSVDSIWKSTHTSCCLY